MRRGKNSAGYHFEDVTATHLNLPSKATK
jgi:hypothetical protein